MKEIKVTTEYNLFEVTVEPKETKVHIVAADLEELQDILDNEEYKRDVDDINHCIPPLNVEWKGFVYMQRR